MKLQLLKTLGAFALGLTTLAATSSDAHADTITYRAPVNKSTGSLANVFRIDQYVSLPKFDDNLGELEKVTVFGRIDFENDIDIEPINGWFAITYNATARVRAYAPGFGEYIDAFNREIEYKPNNGPGVKINVDASVIGAGSTSSMHPAFLNYLHDPDERALHHPRPRRRHVALEHRWQPGPRHAVQPSARRRKRPQLRRRHLPVRADSGALHDGSARSRRCGRPVAPPPQEPRVNAVSSTTPRRAHRKVRPFFVAIALPPRASRLDRQTRPIRSDPPRHAPCDSSGAGHDTR